MGYRYLVLEPKLRYLFIQHIVAECVEVPGIVLLAEDLMDNNASIVPALMELTVYVGRLLGAQDKEC